MPNYPPIFRLAIRHATTILAQKHQRASVAAIILTNDRKMISFGVNNMIKSHPFIDFGPYDRPVTIHAEIGALLKALKRVPPEKLEGGICVTARVKKDGTVAMARPCDGCRAHLAKFGIKDYWFTTDEGWVKERVG